MKRFKVKAAVISTVLLNVCPIEHVGFLLHRHAWDCTVIKFNMSKQSKDSYDSPQDEKYPH